MKQSTANRIVAKSLNTGATEQRIQAAKSAPMQLARLHLAYGKALSEGRTADAQAIKAEATALSAASPVEYSAFAAAQAVLNELQAA